VALYDLHDQPALDAPVLIMVLEGWIDAGFAAGTAMGTLLAGLDTEPVATFDTDQLLDHRARRPIMHLVDGVNTGMSWPSIELRAGTDLDGNDVLLLLGAEPDHAWHAFTEATMELIQDLGARLVVGLGAYPAAVPHTRPVTLSVTASTNELAVVSGLLRGSLDVPAGVQAAIESRCGELELPAVGIWAQVPHYVSGEPTPYPAASLALLDQLETTAGLRLPKAELSSDAERTRNRIDVAMAANDDHLGLLKTLEERHDEMLAEAASTTAEPMIPSADELGAEVERFLRDQDADED
jgi:hypothetical protein